MKLRLIIKPKALKLQSQGYTLLEMMIGTTILSILIVLCISIFVLIGRIYYKGFYERQTQDVANNLSNSIYEAVTIYNDAPDLKDQGGGWQTLCFGNTQYTFTLDKQLVETEVLTNNPSNDRITGNALIVSEVSKCPTLLNPASTQRGIVIQTVDAGVRQDKYKIPNGIELLRENMRLLEFSVDEVDPHGCKTSEDANSDGKLQSSEDTYIANNKLDQWDACPFKPYTYVPSTKPQEKIFISPSLWNIRIKLAYGGQAEDCQADDETFITYIQSPTWNPPEPSPSKDDMRDYQTTTATFSNNDICGATGTHKIKIERCELDQSFCAVISIHTRALSLK